MPRAFLVGDLKRRRHLATTAKTNTSVDAGCGDGASSSSTRTSSLTRYQSQGQLAAVDRHRSRSPEEGILAETTCCHQQPSMTLTFTPTSITPALTAMLPPPPPSPRITSQTVSKSASNPAKLFRPFEDNDDGPSSHWQSASYNSSPCSTGSWSSSSFSSLQLHLRNNSLCTLLPPAPVMHISTGHYNKSNSENSFSTELQILAKFSNTADENDDFKHQPISSRSSDELTNFQPRSTANGRETKQCDNKLENRLASAGNGLEAGSHATTNTSGRNRFSCPDPDCGKSYLSPGALKMHQRTHTLPCRCDTCGKAFSRLWLLQGHVRTHTGERPFHCDVCGRAFADRSNLRSHQQTHAAVKRHVCEACGRTFSRSSLLSKHATSVCKVKRRQQLQTL